jgi:hypothetical protein
MCLHDNYEKEDHKLHESYTSGHILLMPYNVGNTFVPDTINLFGMFNTFRTIVVFSLLCRYL